MYGMVIGLGWGYMIGGFLRENLSIFSVFSQEGFLWFRCLCLHSQVGGHGWFVEGGCSKGSDKVGSAFLNVVDDVGVDCPFSEVVTVENPPI